MSGRQSWWSQVKDLGHQMVRALRHGGRGHRGRLDPAGWIRIEESARLLRVDEGTYLEAIATDAEQPRSRFEHPSGWVRAIEGHSKDSGLVAGNALHAAVDPQSLWDKFGLEPEGAWLWHGTDLVRVDGIVCFGLLPGGDDEKNRLYVFWVIGGSLWWDRRREGSATRALRWSAPAWPSCVVTEST